jgi:polyferredoxin
MPIFSILKFYKPITKSALIGISLLLIALAPSALMAQYQQSPPDFGGVYSFPTPAHPEPSADYWRILDIALLTLALALAAWLILKSRNRKGVLLLSIGSVAYFGFFRKGCICSVGAIQNVVLCLANPQYSISLSIILIFFLPLVATLLFGRIFCGGVCPLGALQDLVIFKPLRVPQRLDKALRWLQYLYLGLAIFFAGWGLNLTLWSHKIKIGQRFLICEWDPFISIFRRSGPFYMVMIAAAFIIAGMFIGRPYCRWLCPYGGILVLLSRVSWKNVSITPDKELDCGLCADACPHGSIFNLRADRALCYACTRCYEYCPRQKRLDALKAGSRKSPPMAIATSGYWESVVRTWIGILSGAILLFCAIWLAAVYVHAQRMQPGEKVLIETLKEKAKTDAEVQKILQPELNRQHDKGVFRRKTYDRVGTSLLISAGILIFWLIWLRPKQGTGAGVPRGLLKYLEKSAEAKRTVPKKTSVDSHPVS